MRIGNVIFKSRVIYENSKNGLSYSQKDYIDRFEVVGQALPDINVFVRQCLTYYYNFLTLWEM